MTATQYDLLEAISQPGNSIIRFLLPVVGALFVHAAVQYGEPHGHHAMGAHLLFAGLATRLIHQHWHFTITESFGVAMQMIALFWLVISTSMFIYRLFFHRLNGYPGPVWARFSMWTWVPTDLKGQRHVTIQQLHKQYGPVVRVGPNHLSINDPDAIPLIQGMNTVKGPWYEAQSFKPGHYALQNEPTHASHSARRRLWDPAFTIKAARAYERLIFSSRQDLCEHLDAMISSPQDKGRVDLHEVMLLFGFDTMSKLGFSRSFDLLTKTDNRWLLDQVARVPFVINTLGDVPYCMSLLRYLGNPLKDFRAWTLKAIDWRLQQIGKSEYDHADVFAYLTGEEVASRGTKAIHDQETLFQDALLLIVAGSDTTANTMTNLIYELTQQPELYKRLQQEMDSLFPENNDEPEDLDMIRDKATFLKACIHESMRLWPVVPTGLQRRVIRPFHLPTGELAPMGTAVAVNLWTLHRDPRNFERPDEFIPERWLDENGELNIESKRSGEAPNRATAGNQDAKEVQLSKYSPHNTKAFAPFSSGPTSCVGKNVAWAEMRAVLSSFLLKYDIEMTDKDYKSYGASFTDHFVSGNGPCWITLKHRKERSQGSA